MTPALYVQAPGVACSVQDLGRPGHQRFGVPVSGAMDPFSLQAGNLLVGNARGAAAIEMAMQGLVLDFVSGTLLSVSGADLGARLDDEPIPLWKTVAARPGQRLRFTGPARGAWTYVCVAGGIDVPPVMGSRSTCARAGFGGHEGRMLQSGDELRAGTGARNTALVRHVRPDAIPAYPDSIELRVVPGPQESFFQDGALRTLLSSGYTVTRHMDRMGYRLSGPALAHAEAARPVSEATALGSIQVPPDGQPIVLMPDRQTVGGYPKIATIVSVDVPRLARLLPGSRVRFRAVSIEEAQQEARSLERLLAGIEAECRRL
jgi:antagonist of KipI